MYGLYLLFITPFFFGFGQTYGLCIGFILFVVMKSQEQVQVHVHMQVHMVTFTQGGTDPLQIYIYIYFLG